MKNIIIQAVFVFVVSIVLTACDFTHSSRNVFLDEKCDFQKIEDYNRVQWGLSHVKLDMDIIKVQSYIGVADKWESFVLTDGRKVEVMYYRTNYHACGTIEKQSAWGEFLPMVFSDGILKGYGNNYYDNMIRPAIKQELKNWHQQHNGVNPSHLNNYPAKYFPYGEQDYSNYN